jgi:ubiquinone/menaquinone biosynthesis C-methylase UbiE
MSFVRQVGYRVKKMLGYKWKYPSETGKVRPLVERFCTGYGCDIGFGGDKIKKDNCVGIDYAKPYAYTGDDKVDIACDVMHEEIPVPANTYDYVYSSHLIEDFTDTNTALRKFIKILKSNGNLILVFPDQQKYEAHCLEHEQPINTHHVHKDMGLAFMQKRFSELQEYRFEELYISNCDIDYNVIIVVKVNKQW